MAKKLNRNYKDDARKLKKLGLIDRVDLRLKEFDSATKQRITKAAKKYEHYIHKHSRKTYEATYIPSKAQRDRLADSGYLVKGKRVIIDRDSYNSVRVQKSIKPKGGKRKQLPGGVIKRKIGKKTVYELVASGAEMSDIARDIDQYIESYEGKAEISVTGKFGDNAPFNLKFDSAQQMQMYLEVKFNPKWSNRDKQRYRRANKAGKLKMNRERAELREELLSQVSVVVIEQ